MHKVWCLCSGKRCDISTKQIGFQNSGWTDGLFGTNEGYGVTVVEYAGVTGLVEEQIDRKDRRRKHLSLTTKGENLLRFDPLEDTVMAIGQLTVATQRSLAKSLQAILSDRLTARSRQPFGQCGDFQYFASRHPEGDPHCCQLLEEALAESDAQEIFVKQAPK